MALLLENSFCKKCFPNLSQKLFYDIFKKDMHYGFRQQIQKLKFFAKLFFKKASF